MTDHGDASRVVAFFKGHKEVGKIPSFWPFFPTFPLEPLCFEGRRRLLLLQRESRKLWAQQLFKMPSHVSTFAPRAPKPAHSNGAFMLNVNHSFYALFATVAFKSGEEFGS